MLETITAQAKYIFLDVVDFTYNRSVEAQSDIIQTLNKVVVTSLIIHKIEKDWVICIPTGDGICITFLDETSPYDIHLLVALSILNLLSEHNSKTKDDMRRFEVRIGINSNTDNLITDINGNKNIAGAGINMASRIMNIADGNQILVGESVYETLRYREKYMNSFKRFSATVKHDFEIPVYQFIEYGHAGLNISVPSILEPPDPHLTKTAAYYFAHAIRNRHLSLQATDYSTVQSIIILLWFRARKSERKAQIIESPAYTEESYETENGSFEHQLRYYESFDKHIKEYLAELIRLNHLVKYESYFEPRGILKSLLINEKGETKLCEDWQRIWEEFEIYRYK